MQPLVFALAAMLQKRMLALIQRAYATLTAAQLGSYLGVQETEALQCASFSGHALPIIPTSNNLSSAQIAKF